MLFTFFSITYNHEKYIAQHLESIKYQILNYGAESKFQFIVSDDCSTDNTMAIIHNWLEENSTLFQHVELLENETNHGLCRTYTRGLKRIKGRYYKSLEGDDVYAKDNIFEAVKLLETYDIVITPIGPFKNENLFTDKKILSRIYSMYKFCNTDYRVIRKYNTAIPMSPGIFIRRELLSEEVLSFINQFTFIEDRSGSIKIYEENTTLKIGYCEKILVLYRHHENAITKTTNKRIIKLFKEDNRKIDAYVANNSKGIFAKCLINLTIFRRKLKNGKIADLLNVGKISYRISFITNYYKYREKIKTIKNESYIPNNEHLRTIIKEANKYNANKIDTL